MRLTANKRGQYTGAAKRQSAAVVSDGATIPSPTGGWDANSPIANMPPQNAIALINWFPQPGYVELRRGHVIYADTGTGSPVETLMGYQSELKAQDQLFAASAGEIFDITGGGAASIGAGYSNNRWQFTNFNTTGGSYLWMCNGQDSPQFWDGSTLTTAAITGTGFAAADMIYVEQYRSRLWTVIRDSSKAVYLPLDSIQGAGTVFDVGAYFRKGGYLQAIGTWSTDTIDGPNEFIAFVSSYGDVAIFLITDPTQASGISYRGTADIGSPIGRRCLCKIGADLGIISIDGVLPLSQVMTYDRAALARAALTANIRPVMTDAAQRYKDLFGWELSSYPRNTMAILNVPLGENSVQDQFVMNTITGAWARFTGQNANAWEIWQDRAYFGGNDGVVRLADEAAGDENQTLTADMRCAFNYYNARGQIKRWNTVRPSITVDVNLSTIPQMGLNIDFGTNALVYPISFNSGETIAVWDSSIWNQASWPGETTRQDWNGVTGMGYCASIRMTVEVPWSENARTYQALKVNSFDVVYDRGGIIG